MGFYLVASTHELTTFLYMASTLFYKDGEIVPVHFCRPQLIQKWKEYHEAPINAWYMIRQGTTRGTKYFCIRYPSYKPLYFIMCFLQQHITNIEQYNNINVSAYTKKNNFICIKNIIRYHRDNGSGGENDRSHENNGNGRDWQLYWQ